MSVNSERATSFAEKFCAEKLDNYRRMFISLRNVVLQDTTPIDREFEYLLIDHFLSSMNVWSTASTKLQSDQQLLPDEIEGKMEELTDRLIGGTHTLDLDSQNILSMRIAILYLRKNDSALNTQNIISEIADGNTQKLEPVRATNPTELEDTVQGKPLIEFPSLSKRQVEEKLKALELLYRTNPPMIDHYDNYINELARIGFLSKEADGGRQIIVDRIADYLSMQEVPFIEKLLTKLKFNDEKFAPESREPLRLKALLLWSLIEPGENPSEDQIRKIYNNYLIHLYALKDVNITDREIWQITSAINRDREKMRDHGEVFDNTPFYLRLAHRKLTA